MENKTLRMEEEWVKGAVSRGCGKLWWLWGGSRNDSIRTAKTNKNTQKYISKNKYALQKNFHPPLPLPESIIKINKNQNDSTQTWFLDVSLKII